MPMPLLNVRDLLEATFTEEPRLPAPIDDVQFVSRHLVDTYIVDAGGERLVAQVARGGISPLLRLKRNLGDASRLKRGRQLPAVLAWRQGGDEGLDPWALIVTSYVPGEELKPSTLSQESWASLCGLLESLHSMPANRSDGNRLTRAADGPAAFNDVAQQLETYLPAMGWPVRSIGVRRQLREITTFLGRNAAAFELRPCFIHGDLSRANIRISGGVAGLVDWADAGGGDYAFDLGCLKFALDSVVPRSSPRMIQELARRYRSSFGDENLEMRLTFYLAFTGLVHALVYAMSPATFNLTRAMRVRACLLHSQAQWRSPLQLDGVRPGAPAAVTDHSWFRLSAVNPRAGSQLH
jgi:aminoglycoside phosphotransferase (APT) family kinase protein